MKILFVVDITMSNPFVETLCDGLKKEGVTVKVSIDEFWNSVENYDVIHFQWPEAIYSWKNSITDDQVKKFRLRLVEIKRLCVKICITCHNLKPHIITDKNVKALYGIIYQYSDLFLHMGSYSMRLLEEAYPNAQHRFLPHHLYDNIYHFERQKIESKKALGITPLKCCILCFGEFRTDEERQLVLKTRRVLKNLSYCFITPGFYKKKIISKNMVGIFKNVFLIIYYKCLGLKPRRDFISYQDTERYFCAADIVMIQRVSILNSGNLPMAFAAGKVVIGPNVGNVGDILSCTGNPTFNPLQIDTIVEAAKKAKKLMEQGKGEENRVYAEKRWSTTVVVEQLLAYYKKIIDDSQSLPW